MITAIIVILVVIATAFLLYVISHQSGDSECLNTWGSGRQPIIFQNLVMDGSPPTNITVSWKVESVYCPALATFSEWKAAIFRDGQPLSPSITLIQNKNIQFGTEVRLVLTDGDGNGKLTRGDSFLIYGMSGDHAWKFTLVWGADGSEMQSMSWYTP